MPSQKMLLKPAALTDVGLVRANNEDYVAVLIDENTELSIAVLADGMGGEAAGEVASKVCVDSCIKYIEKNKSLKLQTLIRDAINFANEQVYSLAQANPRYSGMGTTLCLFVFDNINQQAYIGWVGDSRIYHLQSSKKLLKLITRDDTFVNEMLLHGILDIEAAQNHPDSHLLTQAVGTKPQIECIHVDGPFELDDDDRILMTSDGIHDVLDLENDYTNFISREDLYSVGSGLIEYAKQASSADNLSAVLLQANTNRSDKRFGSAMATRYG